MTLEITRDSRLLVAKEGGMMGRLDVIDITLDQVADEDDFAYVRQQLELIATTPVEAYDMVEDSSYRIALGPHDALQENLVDIFSCEKFRPFPMRVLRFCNMMHKAAKPENRILKP